MGWAKVRVLMEYPTMTKKSMFQNEVFNFFFLEMKLHAFIIITRKNLWIKMGL